jgi:hypothetical protein
VGHLDVGHLDVGHLGVGHLDVGYQDTRIVPAVAVPEKCHLQYRYPSSVRSGTAIDILAH